MNGPPRWRVAAHALAILVVLVGGVLAAISTHEKPRLLHSSTVRLASLLAPLPDGWVVVAPPHPLSVVGVSDQFGARREVLHSLRRDSLQRGIERKVRDRHSTYVDEQLWQYRHLAGATAFFEEYVSKSSPGPDSNWDLTFDVADRGVGFADDRAIDGDYSAAVLLDENDILIQLEVTSPGPITPASLSDLARQVVPPVAHGISVRPVPVPTPLALDS